jgi:uncharacterized membrane protein YeaQ/YmgE (transglycosylase-associated protein family)
MRLPNLIWFLLIGLAAGWLAGKVMRGKGYGVFGDILIGAIGGVVGGWLFGLAGISAGGLLGALVTAFVGAIALIWSTTFPAPDEAAAPTAAGALLRSLPGLCGPGVRLAGAAFLLAFFTVHFGMFHFVHAVFLGLFFPLAAGTAPGFASVVPNATQALHTGWPLVVGSAISHRAAFTRARTTFRPETPYKSVVRMHILIFVFAGARIAGWDSRLLYLVVLFFYFFPFGALRELFARAPHLA